MTLYPVCVCGIMTYGDNDVWDNNNHVERTMQSGFQTGQGKGGACMKRNRRTQLIFEYEGKSKWYGKCRLSNAHGGS